MWRSLRPVFSCLTWVGCVVVFALEASRYRRWLVDDAMISFGYARTLSEGGGLAQQPGAAPVEGISNPTWTLLLAALHSARLFLSGQVWFGIPDYVLVPKAIGGLCFVGTLVAAFAALRSLVTPGGATFGLLVTGLFLATSPGYVIWAVAGLENPLYGLIVALLAALVCRTVAAGHLLRVRTAVFASLLALLAATTRPDGVVYAAAYPLAVLLTVKRRTWRRSVRPLLVAVSTFAGPAAALLLLRHAVFGLWVPNTAVAKSQRGVRLQSLLDVSWHPLADLVTAVTPVTAVGGVVLVTAALVLRIVRGRMASADLPDTAGSKTGSAATVLVIPFVLAVLAFGALAPDWMGMWRFATPALVTGALLLGAASAILVEEARRWVSRLVIVATSAIMIMTSIVGLSPRVDQFTAHPTVPGCYVVDRFGRTFNDYADRLNVHQGTVLAPDIGGLLLTSRLTVVDLAGLTSPLIALLRSHRDDKGLANYVFDDLRPTFIQLHPPWSRHLISDQRLRRDYVPLVGDQDWVRRSAIPAGYDLARLRSHAQELVRTWDAQRVADPLSSCGELAVGQPP